MHRLEEFFIHEEDAKRFMEVRTENVKFFEEICVLRKFAGPTDQWDRSLTISNMSV